MVKENMRKIIITLSFCIALCACVANQDKSLDGAWLLKTNSGESYSVNITQLSPETIIIDAEEILLSGRYQVDGKFIYLLEANQPRISSVEFTLAEDGKYYVTKSPSAARIGIQLKGSSITRQ